MSGKTTADAPRIDRRAARTRRLLHQALMQLIVRKDYEAITIQDLLDEADVGRSTFYAHFAGKDDLLRRGFDGLRAELAAAETMHEEGEPLGFSTTMFTHAERYKEIYRSLAGSRGNSIVWGEIRRVLLEFVEPAVERTGTRSAPIQLMARYLVDAFQSVLSWWLERHAELTAEQIDGMFRQLVLPSLTSQQNSDSS